MAFCAQFTDQEYVVVDNVNYNDIGLVTVSAIVSANVDPPCPEGSYVLVTQAEHDALGGGGSMWSLSLADGALVFAAVVGSWAAAWGIRQCIRIGSRWHD